MDYFYFHLSGIGHLSGILGPSRYQWDNAYFALDIGSRMNIAVFFIGGVLNGSESKSPTVVKAYIRKAQFGETFTFEKKVVSVALA